MIIDFSVANQKIIWPKERFFIADSVGHVHLRCSFDGDWSGLTKRIIFKNGDVTKALLLTDNEPICVPHEVLTQGKLFISIVGLSADGVKKLTTRKMILPVAILEAGAQEGDDPEEYTPELWEQALIAIGDLTDLRSVNKSSLVMALNEVLLRGGGSGGGDAVIGIDGGYYLPDVDEDGNISWIASKDDMPSVPSVNIKGEPGEPGAPGEPGRPGAPGEDGADGVDGIDGYTPVRGVDYWNDDDIDSIKAYIDSAVPSGGGQTGGSSPRWELLNALTTSEEVASVELTQDSEGVSYSTGIKRMIAIIITSYQYATYTGYLGCYFGLNASGTDGKNIPLLNAIYTGKTYASHAEIDLSGGLPRVYRRNGTVHDQPENLQELSFYKPLELYNKHFNTVYSVKLSAASGKMIPNGTQIYIFGMRG